MICADGNFHCEQMYMKKAMNDVALRDGEGFMVESFKYNEHLKARDGDRQEVGRMGFCGL